jgi:hypothetical protein
MLVVVEHGDGATRIGVAKVQREDRGRRRLKRARALDAIPT